MVDTTIKLAKWEHTRQCISLYMIKELERKTNPLARSRNGTLKTVNLYIEDMHAMYTDILTRESRPASESAEL